jgi:hypothetical protein
MPAPGAVLRYAAFAETDGGGNPAGVVLDARGMDADAMRALAAEVGYSETAFLVPGADGAADIRYFSPRPRSRSAATPPSRPPSRGPSDTARGASSSTPRPAWWRWR